MKKKKTKKEVCFYKRSRSLFFFSPPGGRKKWLTTLDLGRGPVSGVKKRKRESGGKTKALLKESWERKGEEKVVWRAQDTEGSKPGTGRRTTAMDGKAVRGTGGHRGKSASSAHDAKKEVGNQEMLLGVTNETFHIKQRNPMVLEGGERVKRRSKGK